MEFRYPKQEYSLSQLMSLEWLDTNGLGGYASSTILGCNTRKYHGLLVSKISNLTDKYVLLSKFDDTLLLKDKQHHLTIHSYRNSFQDEAFSYFQEFVFDLHPQIVYKLDNEIYLAKEILLLSDSDTILIKYKLVGHKGADAKLTLRPLFAYRNFHALSSENSFFNTVVTKQDHGYKIAPYDGMPAFYLKTSIPEQTNLIAESTWYRSFYYDIERQRGYPDGEDLCAPLLLEIPFGANGEIIIAGSLYGHLPDLTGTWHGEMERRRNTNLAFSGSPFQRQLKKKAQDFLNKNLLSSDKFITAGYHWFLEWGRDTMIALPGLTLYSGREQDCLAILKRLAQHEKNGLIPNCIDVGSTANDIFNSVDASLWFAWAVQQYYDKTKNHIEIATHLWPTLRNIFKHYKEGTLFNVKMQENGLLYAGSPDVNVTWMDAVANGKPVTPRYGFQVEVNALWFNMLNFMYELSLLFLDPLKHEIAKLLPKIRLSFCQTFYNADRGYLYDFVNDTEKNAKLRPNQIFAVSLPHSPLPKKIALKVLAAVHEQLLTPYGLRTLSPKEEGYRGVYQGNQTERDLAYHNGTVFTWLIGPFGEAILKFYKKKHALEILQPCLIALKKHLSEGGIGNVAEIFAGDKPHKADGCIHQAWSVAEILRLTYLLNIPFAF